MDLAIVIGCSAHWAMAVTRTDGPGNVFKRLRGTYGKPFTCALCMAIWVAVPVAILLLAAALRGGEAQMLVRTVFGIPAAAGYALGIMALCGVPVEMDRHDW